MTKGQHFHRDRFRRAVGKKLHNGIKAELKQNSSRIRAVFVDGPPNGPNPPEPIKRPRPFIGAETRRIAS